MTDIEFDIELSMKEMQALVLEGKPVDEALLDGFGLRINTWGAFSALVMDQFSADFIPWQPDEDGNCNPIFSIRDSTLELCLDLRSKGIFFATLGEMTSGSVKNISLLAPDLVVPLSGELIIDVEISNVTVSPM